MEERIKRLKEELVEKVSEELERAGIKVSGYTRDSLMDIPVSVSARHIHLSRRDMDRLFGQGSELTVYKNLSQPGQFAAAEKVVLEGPKGRIENVRILGPLRSQTQAELAPSDARHLGLHLPVRPSGDLKETPGAVIIGPAGRLELKEGCIIAERHIHMTVKQARERGLADGQTVQVKIRGPRGGLFDSVHIRVRDDYALDMHIDTDEANAFQTEPGTRGTIII